MVESVKDWSVSRNERTTGLKDGLVRGCVPNYCETATCCVELGDGRCAGGWREGWGSNTCQEDRDDVVRQRKGPWS